MTKELLHQPIFQGVVGNHDQSPTCFQNLDTVPQDLFQGFQFLVDVNTKGLKHPSQRLRLVSATDGAADNTGQVVGRANRIRFTRSNNRTGYAPALSFFTIFPDQVGYVFSFPGIQYFGSSRRLKRTHAHIQRTGLLETEPSRRGINLVGGYTEIEKNSVDFFHAFCFQQ